MKEGVKISTNIDKLKPKQERLLVALFTENTNEAAYKKAGITHNTGYKYLNEPTFQKRYNEMKRLIMQETTQAIQQASTSAVKVLVGILNDTEANNSDKIRVASIILDNAYKALELDDITERIDKLERMTDQEGG